MSAAAVHILLDYNSIKKLSFVISNILLALNSRVILSHMLYTCIYI